MSALITGMSQFVLISISLNIISVLSDFSNLGIFLVYLPSHFLISGKGALKILSYVLP